MAYKGEDLEDARSADDGSFVTFAAVAGVCLTLVFLFAALVLTDAAKEKDKVQVQQAAVMPVEMMDMSVSEEGFRSMLWFRLMEECVEREPEYACIVKVDHAVEIAVSARRWKAGVRHGGGDLDNKLNSGKE